jgi:hypothetical protein
MGDLAASVEQVESRRLKTNWRQIMHALPFAATDKKIEVAKTFAQRFSHFEWEYLCSCQWFLTGIDRGLETGDFTMLGSRAQKTLVDDKIRLGRGAKMDSNNLLAAWLSDRV